MSKDIAEEVNLEKRKVPGRVEIKEKLGSDWRKKYENIQTTQPCIAEPCVQRLQPSQQL